MNGIDFLKLIPHRTVDIEKERVELFRLGTFVNGSVWELVGFIAGSYRPHIHDATGSLFHFIYGAGYILIENEKISYSAGSVIKVNSGQSHGFEVRETTLVLSIRDRAILDEKTGKMDFRFADV